MAIISVALCTLLGFSSVLLNGSWALLMLACPSSVHHPSIMLKVLLIIDFSSGELNLWQQRFQYTDNFLLLYVFGMKSTWPKIGVKIIAAPCVCNKGVPQNLPLGLRYFVKLVTIIYFFFQKCKINWVKKNIASSLDQFQKHLFCVFSNIFGLSTFAA